MVPHVLLGKKDSLGKQKCARQQQEVAAVLSSWLNQNLFSLPWEADALAMPSV